MTQQTQNNTISPKNTKTTWTILIILLVIIIIYAVSTNHSVPATPTEPALTATTTEATTTTSTTTTPTQTINPTAWQSLSSSTTGITFSYPTAAQLNLSYIQTVDWPPQITVSSNPFTCTPSGTAVGPNGKTSIEVVNNNEYCVNMSGEGAAGSVYNTYAYSFPVDGKTLTLNFTLRYPQCENYPDPQMTACKNEESSFSVDQIANAMAQSVHYVRLISPAQPIPPATSTAPTYPININSISPTSGAVGATIIVRGTGFLTDNKVLFDGDVAASDAKLSYFNNGSQSMSITIPSGIGPDCKTSEPCPMYERLVTPGVYTVTVENANGTSNAVSFQVTQ